MNAYKLEKLYRDFLVVRMGYEAGAIRRREFLCACGCMDDLNRGRCKGKEDLLVRLIRSSADRVRGGEIPF